MSRVTIYHNVTHQIHGATLAPAIFARARSGYVDGDTFANAFSYVDERPNVPPAEVCTRAFEIGNIDVDMTSDPQVKKLAGEYRAEKVRSVSVGDVVSVDGHAFSVERFGFEDRGTAAALKFAGGRHAREVVKLVDMFEKTPENQLSRQLRDFVRSITVPSV